MSMTDRQNARRLLNKVEEELTQAVPLAERVRLRIMLAQAWCQVAQADR
jgi:hypothetical protein